MNPVNEIPVKDTKKRRCMIIAIVLCCLAILAVLAIVLSVILTRSKSTSANSYENTTFPITAETTEIGLTSSGVISVTGMTVTKHITMSHHSSATKISTMTVTTTSTTSTITKTTTITTITTAATITTRITATPTTTTADSIVTTSTTPENATIMTNPTTSEDATITATSTTPAVATMMTTPTTTIVTTITSTTSATNFNVIINGDFETGDTTGWIIGGGSRAGINSSIIRAQDYLPGAIRYNSTIASTHSRTVSRTLDPILANSMPLPVRNGNYALRIEDTADGGFLSVATQTVNNYGSPNIYFAWLAVVEKSGHTTDDSSLLLIELKDVTDGTVLLQREYRNDTALLTDTVRFRNSSSYFYTSSWQVESVTIHSTRVGHNFSLTVLVTDCQQSGHRGYMYVDSFGATSP